MISRRHIRLKVMQSLYAHFSLKDHDIDSSEKKMLKHLEEVVDLKFAIFSLLFEVFYYADKFFNNLKNKHFPTIEDLNPNTRFIDNDLVSLLQENEKLKKKAVGFSNIWLDNDHNVITKIFKKLYTSDLYSQYIKNSDNSIDVDQKFLINALNDYILNNSLVHHILEERSIYWIDDLPFVATIIMGYIRSEFQIFENSIFKDHSDKLFALQLFRGTIKSNQEYENIIIRFAKNWDLDRIAIMDQLLLKMSFCELITMNDLPVKVTMNEYIEISKYYSTSKSKLFVNGILDNAVKKLSKEGKIKKEGRGLF